MSFLLYAETVRAAVTKLDINGQGAEAYLDPGVPLRISGTFKAQNPKTDPTDTVQLILFLDDKFFKCVYNNVPEATPDYTKDSFTFSCTTPTETGKYKIQAGWAYNWNWPEQAYNYLLANPENIEDIGVLYVGEVKERKVAAIVLPAALIAIPIVTIIGLAGTSKK